MLHRLLKIAAAAAGLAAATPALAQAPHVQTQDEALAQDAAEYARLQGVSADEAARRLRAEADSVAVTREIQDTYRARLTGISIQHRPDFRIVVLLSGDAPVPARTIEAGGMTVPVEFRTGARATREQVLAAMNRHRAAIRGELPGAEGMGYDARTGDLVVMVDLAEMEGRDAAAIDAHLEELTGVPVRLRILGGSTENNSGVEGGVRVEGVNPGDNRRFFCTTGFVVTDGARTGVLTAAHCPDTLVYRAPGGGEVPLEFVGQWGAQFQDVQVNVGDVGDKPLFFSDTSRSQARALTGARLRSATRAGDTVCHRGEASGYSCSEVDLVDYAPPGDLCGGPCHPVWMTVTGPGCRNGDSGGPVFAGTVALGILKGGNYSGNGHCNFYYYMSTDYLPPGWSLLLDGMQAGRAPAETASVSRTNSPGQSP